MKTREESLTQGNIYKTLIDFALPFVLANLIQALYGVTDLIVVGIFTDTPGLSAVAIGSQVLQVINGLITGLTMAGTIMVGQYFGAKREEDLHSTIGTILVSGFLVSLIITSLMLFSADGLLRLVRTPPQAFVDAKAYVITVSFGVVFIFGYNAISAVLRGLGDSKSPVYFISIACVINILLDFLFVGGFHMRAAGAALATIIAQGTSMLIALFYIFKKKGIFNLKDIHYDTSKAKQLFKLGIPLSFQEILLWSSFLVIAAISNTLGVASSAAVGIVAKFEVFSMLPPMAISYALAALTAQNIGANQSDRALEALKIGVYISLTSSLFFVAWAQLSPQTIIGIFNADKEVVNAGGLYLFTFSTDFILVAIKFNLNGFLNGCGKTTFTMVNGVLSSILVRIPIALVFVFHFSWGLVGLGLAAPIASVASILVSLVFMREGRWNTGSLVD